MKIEYHLSDVLRELMRFSLYQVAKIVPKQRNLWIFGAWKGEKYSDNSKYLFEYVAKQHPEIEVIWITKNKLAYELIAQANLPVKYFTSLAAIWKCMRAGIAITCVDAVLDLPSYAIAGATKRVQLWHGLGPKSYKFDRMNERDARAVKNMGFRSRILNKIVLIYGYLLSGKWDDGIKWLPYYLMPSQDLVITTSKLGKEKMRAVFGGKAKRIEMLGYPRHDSLIAHMKSGFRDQIQVFYAPTHRSESQREVITDMEGLYRSLKDHPEIKFVAKLHDLSSKEDTKIADLQKLPNFQLVSEREIAQDVYTLLPKIDLLITDYSSIYTDFLLLQRPVIFVPFDKTEYENNDQGFFLDYEQITPGPKARNWQEVMKYVTTYKAWAGKYASEQARVLELFHEVRDGQSCKRITQRLLKLSEEVPDSIPN